jgi:hypothetical protein
VVLENEAVVCDVCNERKRRFAVMDQTTGMAVCMSCYDVKAASAPAEDSMTPGDTHVVLVLATALFRIPDDKGEPS